MLIQITCEARCFGMHSINDATITHAAPCARWAIGQPVYRVLRYRRKRGATCVIIPSVHANPLHNNQHEKYDYE